MPQPSRLHERTLLTKEESARGLQLLDELEALDQQQGDEVFSDSTDLIRAMRADRTNELMRKLEE
jgi:hypothetical protein